MAYENRNAAYDLSLFDDSSDYVPGSAAPERKEEVHKKQEMSELDTKYVDEALNYKKKAGKKKKKKQCCKSSEGGTSEEQTPQT